MIAVETGRMKNSLFLEDVAPNERNALFAHPFNYYEVSSSLQPCSARALTTTSFTVPLLSTEHRRLVYRATITSLHWSQMRMQMAKTLFQYPQWTHAVQRHPSS